MGRKKKYRRPSPSPRMSVRCKRLANLYLYTANRFLIDGYWISLYIWQEGKRILIKEYSPVAPVGAMTMRRDVTEVLQMTTPYAVGWEAHTARDVVYSIYVKHSMLEHQEKPEVCS